MFKIDNNILRQFKSLVLPREGNVNKFESISVNINNEIDVRKKQYGMFLELYYVYTFHKLLELSNNKEVYTDMQRRIMQLEKLQSYYEDILLLKYICYDVFEKNDNFNNEILEFMKSILSDIVSSDNNESKNKDVLKSKIEDISFIESNKKDIILKKNNRL